MIFSNDTKSPPFNLEVKLKTPEELEKLKTALLPLGFLCSKQSLQDSRLCLRIDFNFKLLNYSKRYGAEVELEAVFKGVKTAWLAKGYKARNVCYEDSWPKFGSLCN